MYKTYEILVLNKEGEVIRNMLIEAASKDIAEWEIASVLDEIEGASTYQVNLYEGETQ